MLYHFSFSLEALEANVPQTTLSRIPKYYLWGGGAFLVVVLGLIIGAIRPYKHALGAPSVAVADCRSGAG